MRPGDGTQGLLERAVMDEALRQRRAEMRDVALEAANVVAESVARIFEVIGLIEIKDPPSGE